MAMGRLLSDKERDRFATWLEQEAADGDAMAEQMKKSAADAPVILVLAMKERAEAFAARVIAKKLRETESMTVGPGETGEVG